MGAYNSLKVVGPFGPGETQTAPYQTVVFPQAATPPVSESVTPPAAEPAPATP